MLVQHRRRWARIGTALGQRLVFAGSVERPHCVSNIAGCEKDIQTVTPLIDSKDDLVTVDHLPTASLDTVLTQASGVANLAGEDAADIKNRFHHIKKYIVSTLHRGHLITLTTKAIDTTSIIYQPLWLCCWRGDIAKKTTLLVHNSYCIYSSYLFHQNVYYWCDLWKK